jgi:hypothetical protein
VLCHHGTNVVFAALIADALKYYQAEFCHFVTFMIKRLSFYYDVKACIESYIGHVISLIFSAEFQPEVLRFARGMVHFLCLLA